MAEWKGLDVSPPDLLEETRQQVSTFFEVLITILEIVLVTLSVVKVFLVGLINPLVVLLDVIIDFIEGLLLDLRQVGFYLHGDFVYLKGNQGFDNFIQKTSGGYAAYEQRMIDRLLDRNDPGRPDLSSSSAVFSLFFYTSVGGVNEIFQLIEFVKALMKLFNQETENILPVPDRPESQLKYSTSASLRLVNVFSDEEAGVPDVVQVGWDMIQTGNPLGFNLSPLYPERFLLEISTLPTGILIASSKEIDSATATPDGKAEFTSFFYQDPINKGPLRVFGGASRLKLPSGSGWNAAIDGTSFKSGATPIFGIKSPKESEVIPLELLEYEGKNLLGVSYIVENLVTVFKPSFEITEDQLPYSAEFEKGANGTYKIVEGSVQRPRTFYVRVSTCSPNTENTSDVELVFDDPNYTFGNIPPSFELNEGFQLSKVSQVQKISFPSPNANVYIKSLQTALAILVLTRCDVEFNRANFPDFYSKFSSLNASNNAKVKAIMDEFFPSLRNVSKSQENCFDFRLRLLRQIQTASTLMFDRMGDLSEGIYDLVAETQDDLLNQEIFEGKTILQLLEDYNVSEGATVTGIQKNIFSQGTLEEANWISFTLLDTPKVVRETSAILANFDETRTSPLEAQRLNNISATPTSFSWLTDELSPETIAAAARVLQLTPSVARVEGDWIAFRLFPEGLTPVEQFLDTTVKSLKAIKEGLKGVIKAIEEFIGFFEIRIIQLQQILRQIEAAILKLLQMLDLIPSGFVLITNSVGTEGVVTDLINSEDKPPEGDSYHSAGIVALGGGVPTLIVDLIEKLFFKED